MKRPVLYLQCDSGISGDMTVAALLDLGADRNVLSDALASLPLSGYSIEIKEVFKSGIRACDFHVHLEHDNHDHDMEYLHGPAGNILPPADSHAGSELHSQEHTEHAPDSPDLSGHALRSPEPSEQALHDQKHSEHAPDSPDLSGHALHGSEPSKQALHDQEHTEHAPDSPDLSGHALRSPEPSEQVSLDQELPDHVPHNLEHPGHAPHPHLHPHDHEARSLSDISAIIRAGKLTENARALALRIFRILAEAEASVHGKSIDEVHFHEVGAVDSIVDIVAAAVCLDNLQPERVIVSPLTDGTGQIRCQHGLIPVPVPAVTAIARQNGLILKISGIEGELVTPTGAAIAAAFQPSGKPPAEFRIIKTGLGAGKRSYAASGLLRAMLIEPAPQCARPDDTILSLETNIDDCTGEALSFTMQKLLERGALDVFYTPIYMKKNRPACLLRVLCRAEDRDTLESVIFSNTTTIGIRVQEMHRTCLPRRVISLDTPWGPAEVKCCLHGENTFYYPENDSVCRLADTHQIGFPEMYSLIQEYARKTLSEPDTTHDAC